MAGKDRTHVLAGENYNYSYLKNTFQETVMYNSLNVIKDLDVYI